MISPTAILSNPTKHRCRLTLLTVLTCISMAACSPTIKVEAPDKPIVINLNIKIEQEVRIKVEKGVEDLLSDNPDIF
jgi:hypothetical protein